MLALALGLLIASQQNAQQAPPRRDTRTWYQAYADGKRAIDQRNWQAAVDSLEASKRAGAPKPGRKIPFYGDVVDDYIPDYYLGLAYVNLRQYAQAERAFAAVQASGLIGPRDPEYAQLQTQSTVAQNGLGQSSPSAPAAPGNLRVVPDGPQNAKANPVVGGGQVANQAQTPAQKPPAAQAQVPPPVQQAAVQPPPSALGSTQIPAGTPQAQVPSAVQRTVPAANPPPAARRPAGNAVVPPRSNAPYPVRPAPVDPAANEREAMRLYFSGQYADASDRLGLAGAAATPRTYFYAACSRTALAILGQGGPAAIDDAKSLLARAGDLQQLAGDRRYISPRVLQMLGVNP
jgi:hypothetical protein